MLLRPTPELPAPLLPLLARVRRVLEVGAGTDFSTALAVQAAAPEAQVIVSDLDPRVLRAPEPLVPLLLDVTAPDAQALGQLGSIGLVYAVRVPEELQPACARLARRLDAPLALRALKDEWCEAPELARSVVWPLGWRLVVPSAGVRENL